MSGQDKGKCHREAFRSNFPQFHYFLKNLKVSRVRPTYQEPQHRFSGAQSQGWGPSNATTFVSVGEISIQTQLL